MKYDLKSIMLRAWKNYRKYKELSFAECLHRAWITAKAESERKRQQVFRR